MNTEPITPAERKKYVREVLDYHKDLSTALEKSLDHYLQKWFDTLDWAEDRLEEMCKTVRDVLEADTAEDARKVVTAFKESHRRL